MTNYRAKRQVRLLVLASAFGLGPSALQERPSHAVCCVLCAALALRCSTHQAAA